MNLEQLKAALEAAEKRGRELRDNLAAIDAATTTDEAVAALETELDDAVAEVERTRSNLNKRIAQDKILDADPVDVPVKKEPAQARGAQRTELVYRADTQESFFRDLMNAKGGDPRSYERLERNNREWDTVEKRAGINQTATSGGEFSYPVWLNEYAQKLRAGRAIVDAVTTMPFMGGTNSINLPAITTAATTAVQTDGGAVSNTDWVSAAITAQVQTIAGRTVTSQQIIDLSSIGLDQVIFEDLQMSLNQSLDVAVINGAVANAKGILGVTGINSVTYTDASPTMAEAYPSFFQAKSLVEKLGFGSPDFYALHPSVWNNFLAGVDTATRPLSLATNAAAFNAVAGFEYAAQGVVGNFAGLPVVVDANIPTTLGGGTETAIVAVNRRGYSIWEGQPVFKVADQTSITTLQVQFVMYAYYAVMSRQPKLLAKITGTGTIPVSGF